MAESGRGLPRRALGLILGRGLASFGSAVAIFGLEVSLFEQTGSYAAFVLLVVLTGTPTLLLSPIAGLAVDRFHKGRLLALCEVASLGVVLLALAAGWTGPLSAGWIGVVVVALAMIETFRWIALSAALPFLAPRGKLPRLNGINEGCRSLTIVLGPLLGWLSWQQFGLAGMLAFNALAIGLGLALLALCGIVTDASLKPLAVDRRAGSDGWLEKVFFGLAWIGRHRAFRRLTVLFAVANCGFAVLVATITPYVLSFAGPRLLSISMLADGVGVLAGGALLGILARRWPLHRLVLCGLLGEAIAMMVWGTARDDLLVPACAFVIGLCASSVNGASQTLWQSHVPPDIQGRVFSARLFIASALSPIVLLASLPLGTRIFEPFLEWNRAHGWSWIDATWGANPTGALGLMLSLLGALVVVVTVVTARSGALEPFTQARGGDEPALESGLPHAVRVDPS